MSNHTPEPWFSDSEHVGSSVSARLNDGWFAAKCLGPDRVENARRIASCVNACAGMEEPAAEIAELKRQRDELLAAISSIVEEVPHRHGSRGNAPGHGHDVAGIWDDDNGALAGKECGWCKAWRFAVDIYNKTKGGAK